MPLAICITGMHRSGTSMVARVLQAAGLWLGPPEALMPAQADNPDGFAEHLDLVRLADEVLEHHQAAWDAPPGPDSAARMPTASVTARADELLRGLATGAAPGQAWGWKDPRASLLLGFWQTQQPGLRVLVCLRDPLSVARSLQRRHRVSLRFGLRLWLAYNSALLPAVRAGAAVVTDHRAWLADPAAELQRIAPWLGLADDGRGVEEALELVRADRDAALPVSSDELLARAGLATLRLYEELRAAAQAPVSGRVPPATPGPPPMPAQADDEPALLRERLRVLDAELARLRARTAPYRVGTPVDARRGGNAPLFLVSGWAEPQDAGTWSLGLHARLCLPLHGLAPGAGLHLRARVRPLVGPGQPHQTLCLRLGPHLLGQWTLDKPRVTLIECPLPAEVLAPAGPLQLDLEVDAARTPHSLGLSPDTRPLGVLLVSLQLDPA